MSLLTQSQREDLAEAIVKAANMEGTFEGDKFIENLTYTQGIKMTESGKNKIADWIRYSNGAMGKTRDAIKRDYNNPKNVYNMLVQEVRPPLD